MVVDGLAEAAAPGHHDRPVAGAPGQHDRAHPCVADDHPGGLRLTGEGVEGEEVDPFAPPMRNARGAMLDQQRLLATQSGRRPHEAIEGLLVGPHRDEDHRSAKRLPA